MQLGSVDQVTVSDTHDDDDDHNGGSDIEEVRIDRLDGSAAKL